MKKWIYVLLALLCVGLILLGGGYFLEKGKTASLNEQLESLNAAMESERSALQAEAAEKSGALEAITAEAAEKDAQLEAITAEAAETAAQLEAITAEAAEKDAALEAITAEAAEKDAQLEAITAEAAEKAAALESVTAEKESLAAALAEAEAKLESLTAEIAEKSAQLETVTAEAAAVHESLSADLEGREAEIAALHDDAAGRLSEIEMLTAALRGKTEEIEALNADVAGKDAQISALTVPPVSEWDAEALAAVAEGESRNAKRFLLRLQEEGVPCTVEHTEEGDVVRYDRTVMTKAGELSYTLETLFSEDNDSAVLRVPMLIDYRSDDRYCAYYICDKVNAAWRWVKLYTDPHDTVVSAEYDCVLSDSPTAGDSVWAAAERLETVISEAYVLLLPYRK